LDPLDKWALHRLQQVEFNVQGAYKNYEFHKVIQEIGNDFFVTQLSSFYLDVLKDRLYCEAVDSPLRRSSQTVMYEILSRTVRWLAPLLSFTAEEVWLNMRSQLWVSEESIFLSDFPVLKDKEWQFDNQENSFWQNLMTLRDEILVHLEKARQEGKIKNSLEARVLIPALKIEKTIGKEHRFSSSQLAAYMLLSQIEVLPSINEVLIEKAKGQKCSRCWIWKEDVGADSAHPQICGRCASVVKSL
jgi:isoleucyl-tRNA synthetase